MPDSIVYVVLAVLAAVQILLSFIAMGGRLEMASWLLHMLPQAFKLLFGSTGLTITGIIGGGLLTFVRLYRDNRHHRWGHTTARWRTLMEGAVFVVAWWTLVLLYHVAYTIPHEIYAETSSIRPPSPAPTEDKKAVVLECLVHGPKIPYARNDRVYILPVATNYPRGLTQDYAVSVGGTFDFSPLGNDWIYRCRLTNYTHRPIRTPWMEFPITFRRGSNSNTKLMPTDPVVASHIHRIDITDIAPMDSFDFYILKMVDEPLWSEVALPSRMMTKDGVVELVLPNGDTRLTFIPRPK